MLDCVADGVFTVDRDRRITCFNRAAEEITGVPRDEAIGRLCYEVFRGKRCKDDCALLETIRTGRRVICSSCSIVNAAGRDVPLSISTALLTDREGNVIGGVETFRDLSEIERLRKELERQYSFGDIVAKSDAMRSVLETLPRIADSTSTVLIEGESGTGKELVARAVHDLSRRAKSPSSRSIAEHFRIRSWNRNYSDTRPAHLPTRRTTNRADLPRRKGERSFSMKSGTSRRPCRRSCFASCRNASMNRWGPWNPAGPTSE